MNVLIGCEFSGIVRDAFIARGHDAWSCDLLPTEKKGPHLQMDVFEAIKLKQWDLAIFHWPCTYLLLSGVRWFTTIPKKPKPGILYGEMRYQAMIRDAHKFKKLLECGIPKIANENPTMCGDAQDIIEYEWSQRIQPWQFGHGEIKATYLWLVNLPPLKPTLIVPGREARVHKASPGDNRWKERSRTYTGIAKAMAEQWG